MSHHVYLSLGSNMGDRRTCLIRAIEQIQERIGVLVACSTFIETEPWGFESEHMFLNAAIHVKTELSPQQVLLTAKQIEKEMGRERKVVATHPGQARQYADRPIDIDILLYDTVQLSETFTHEGQTYSLVVPHPLMHEREFVMIPLREIHNSQFIIHNS